MQVSTVWPQEWGPPKSRVLGASPRPISSLSPHTGTSPRAHPLHWITLGHVQRAGDFAREEVSFENLASYSILLTASSPGLLTELLFGVFALKESGSFLTPSHPRTAGNFCLFYFLGAKGHSLPPSSNFWSLDGPYLCSWGRAFTYITSMSYNIYHLQLLASTSEVAW